MYLERYCPKCRHEIWYDGWVGTMYDGKKFCECKKDIICSCGDHTENKNRICDCCELLNELDKKHKNLSPQLPRGH
jgi:hypothetical protein